MTKENQINLATLNICALKKKKREEEEEETPI